MPKYDGSIRINTKIETKDLNSQMMRVSNAIKKDSEALDSLNRKMDEFSQKFQSTLPRRERQHLLTSFRLQYGYSLFHLTNKI